MSLNDDDDNDIFFRFVGLFSVFVFLRAKTPLFCFAFVRLFFLLRMRMRMHLCVFLSVFVRLLRTNEKSVCLKVQQDFFFLFFFSLAAPSWCFPGKKKRKRKNLFFSLYSFISKIRKNPFQHRKVVLFLRSAHHFCVCVNESASFFFSFKREREGEREKKKAGGGRGRKKKSRFTK